MQVAREQGWGVRVYHDGSVENVLRRFRRAFPTNVLRCIRVRLSPEWQKRSYIGTFFRLLVADDPDVDVWLSRDLDDPLNARGLRMVTNRWVNGNSNSFVHWQSEQYNTATRQSMVNIGWYGQRNRAPVGGANKGDRRPSMKAAIQQYLTARDPEETDRYTADEDFLSDVWIPLLKCTGFAGRFSRLPSHPYRRPAPPHHRRSRSWHQFWRSKPDTANVQTVDTDVHLHHQEN